MSYVKYLEDDVKIIEHRRFLSFGSEIPSKNRKPIRYYECKYCHAIFTSRSELFHHIKVEHSIVRPLVMVNGKIASDNYIVHFVDSAHIDLFGYCDIISLNGRSISYSQDDDTIDITSQLRKILLDSSACTIAFQSGSVEIKLVAVSIEDMNLIENAIEQWEQEVSSCERLSTNIMDQATDGNRTFLTGMYNYYVACRAKKDKAKRYDDAWSILSNFNSVLGVGRCALKAIAYRRNWLYSLQSLSDSGTDDLSIANDYYQRRPSNFEGLATGKQLYVEDGTKMSLELVRLFQMGKYDELREKLTELPDFDMLDDLNLVDQLNLLSARLSVVDGDSRNARLYYEKLVTPAFQEEYTLFKKGLLNFE